MSRGITTTGKVEISDKTLRNDLEKLVTQWINEQGSTLIGKAFDVSHKEGKDECVEWLCQTIMGLNKLTTNKGYR